VPDSASPEPDLPPLPTDDEIDGWVELLVDRHDPRCKRQPCTCAEIARQVREADAALAAQIRNGA
jgi:hypothetical protein